MQGRERVIGDLRLGVRDAAQERRLARVGQPNERGVGKQLEVQLHFPLLSRPAQLGEARGLASWSREAAIPAPSDPAAGDHRARAGMREIGDDLALLVQHLGADRNVQLHACPGGSVFVLPATVSPAPSREPPSRTEGGQITQVRIGDIVFEFTPEHAAGEQK